MPNFRISSQSDLKQQSLIGETDTNVETCIRNLYVSIYVIKIVWFDWSAVFESFWYKNL